MKTRKTSRCGFLRRTGALGVLLGMTGIPLPALAEGNADAAKARISMCIGCHGIPDYKATFPHVYRVPKIAGQNAAYLENALQAYRKGDRNHPTMKAIAGALSDQEIADLAAYYSAAR